MQTLPDHRASASAPCSSSSRSILLGNPCPSPAHEPPASPRRLVKRRSCGPARRFVRTRRRVAASRGDTGQQISPCCVSRRNRHRCRRGHRHSLPHSSHRAGTSRGRGTGRGVNLPEHTVQIDARGMFLMPALWDMHSHVIAIFRLLAGLSGSPCWALRNRSGRRRLATSPRVCLLTRADGPALGIRSATSQAGTHAAPR
jgi:hypothetical protein